MYTFEEKYNKLMELLLPMANKCIDSFEPITFTEQDDKLIPIVKLHISDDCSIDGINKISIKTDVFSNLIKIHRLYFPDTEINATLSNITIVKK